jgi:hypothetical protein
MTENKFKTMRHIETTRNYLNAVIKEILLRAESHDQSKLQSPEAEVFEEYTPKLRDVTYGSDEYKKNMEEMKPAIDHHNKHNRHHPEHTKDGIMGMNLIDLIEMLCDWKAATLRHDNGDIYKSLTINAERFGIPDALAGILKNTIDWIEDQSVTHWGDES